tara:strand:- start:21216 stop:22295 length:1080 start_codon:yes stop_codon:yes gene_type:complete
MKVFDVVIIGYGIVGKRRHHYIDLHKNLNAVAVCDVRFLDKEFRDGNGSIYNNYDDIEKMSKKKKESGKMSNGVMYFSDYADLLENIEYDIVFVSLPNYLAPKVTMIALSNGAHVFCEKPPGRTVQDIEEVIKVENKYKSLKLKYGFNHRYHGSVIKAKKIIDSEIFGKIINMKGVYGKSSIVPVKKEWRSMSKYSGGGILLDQGIHMLDLFRFFCGDFDEIKSFVSNDYWNHDVEDNAYSIMKSKNGTVAMIHSSGTLWQHRFRLEISFEKGYLELSGILSGSKSYGRERLIIIKKIPNSNVGSLGKEEINYLRDESWKNEIDDFVKCILENKKVEIGSSEDALNVMKLVHDIYSSDK